MFIPVRRMIDLRKKNKQLKKRSAFMNISFQYENVFFTESFTNFYNYCF